MYKDIENIVERSQYKEILSTALEIVDKAGNILLKYFRSDAVAYETKTNSSDIVTVADKETEKFVIEKLKKRFPSHGIISEESLPVNSTSPWQWIIDPLDGTTNFSKGLPIFNISIGIEKDGVPVVGVIYAPYLEELFFAVKDEGAYFNGNRINVSDTSLLEESVVATGLPYDKKVNPDNNLEEVALIAPEVRGLRRLGSAALDLAYVAAGFFDAYWELDLKHWDVAAGILLVREAGGEVFNLRVNRNYSILAANTIISHKILSLLLTSHAHNHSFNLR